MVPSSVGRPEQSVIILTGVGPLHLYNTREMGIDAEVFKVLGSAMNKDTFSPRIPTIGAVTVATFAEKQQIHVQVRDFYASDLNDCCADIIGISSTFMGLQHIKEIASFARQKNPSSTIVLGGPISWSLSPSALFELIPEIDVIVMGEGEQTFVELVKAVSADGNLNRIKGLFLKQGHRYSFTGMRGPLSGDSIPTPQWKLLDVSFSQTVPFFPVETSRGCPYNCAYCSEVHYWGKPPRYRSLSAVLDEIQHHVDEFGITTFRFTDSCFSAPPERAATICNAIYDRFVRNGIAIRWSSYARIDNLTYNLLEKMKHSGCFALDIGVESGAPSILKKMGRNYSKEQIISVAKAARELDMITDFNIVVGFPGETVETVEQTIDMLQEAKPDAFSCFVLFVAPHMAISEYRVRYGLLGSGLSWSHTTMTSEDAYKALERISQSVTSSCSFPGAESFACYLAAIGYSPKQIRVFLKATTQLARGGKNETSRTIVEEACRRLQNWW